MIYNNILEALGHTPIIRLNRMVSENSAEVLVKYEGLNVGGSIKTRTAYNMLKSAEKDGLINENKTKTAEKLISAVNLFYGIKERLTKYQQ